MPRDQMESQAEIPQPAPQPSKRTLNLDQQIGIVVVSIILVVVAIVIFASSSAPAMKSDQVKIVVTNAGSWYGSYYDGQETHTWNGYGETSIIVTRASSTSTISAMAMSTAFSSSGTITLQIIGSDGQILDEDSSDSAFDVVMVSWTPG